MRRPTLDPAPAIGATTPSRPAAAPSRYAEWMDRIRIVDVTDAATFGLLPPCADPSFDHRSCDYWEEADRGSKAHRASWLRTGDASREEAPPQVRRVSSNPFLADLEGDADNPFALKRTAPANPFLAGGDTDSLADNPFAPKRAPHPTVAPGAAPKLALLDRGLAVFGSYAKVLLVPDETADGGERPVAYAQFGPLSAYPRALRTRELYPKLPQSPLPAIITCIAVVADQRGRGLGRLLVEAVCADLAGRGFAAVEAYPEAGQRPDATSAATPRFWVEAGFAVVVADERYPVVRREL